MNQLFTSRIKRMVFLIICIYVDDIIYMGLSPYLIYESEFDMMDLGKLYYFIGLEVYQVDHGIFISQKKICWICSKNLTCCIARQFLPP